MTMAIEAAPTRPRVVAGAALRAARIARRPARVLRLHRLHRARRDGDCRRRLGRGQPQRRADARGPHVARRRRRLLADPARSQARRDRVPARARRSFGRGRLARDGPQRRRQAGAGRTQGGRRQLPDARRVDARSRNADAGFAGAARRRVRRGGGFHAAGAARSQARRPRHASATPAFRSAAWSAPSRTSSPAMSASARASWSARQPARHRIVAARQPGALDLPAEIAGQCGRRTRREAIDRQRAKPRCRKPAGRSAAAATPRRSSNAPSAVSRSS